MSQKRNRLSINEYLDGIRQQDRIVLGKAFSLVESNLPSDKELANSLLAACKPFTGNSFRIGITGPPGVGKSTFINALGSHVVALDKQLAILTIDPSSETSMGSILGDKTRMNDLIGNSDVFIRPSPNAGQLGGVSQYTLNCIAICEAAGFPYIFIETVGVGQSEIAIKNLCDAVFVLLLPQSGDEVQGIKKGIMEIGDYFIVHKADGDLLRAAQQTKTHLRAIVALLKGHTSRSVVHAISSTDRIGIAALWEDLEAFQNHLKASGELMTNRKARMEKIFRQKAEQELIQKFFTSKNKIVFKDYLERINSGKLSLQQALKGLIESITQ